MQFLKPVTTEYQYTLKTIRPFRVMNTRKQPHATSRNFIEVFPENLRSPGIKLMITKFDQQPESDLNKKKTLEKLFRFTPDNTPLRQELIHSLIEPKSSSWLIVGFEVTPDGLLVLFANKHLLDRSFEKWDSNFYDKNVTRATFTFEEELEIELYVHRKKDESFFTRFWKSFLSQQANYSRCYVFTSYHTDYKTPIKITRYTNHQKNYTWKTNRNNTPNPLKTQSTRTKEIRYEITLYD